LISTLANPEAAIMDKKRGSFRVEVKPEVISWAVSSSGWQVSDISEHLGVESASVRAWMSGKATPSLRQLERLAELIKRPLAVFFLPKPPREAPLPKDYRVSPERRGEFDRETLLAVRKTRRLQRLSRELLENQNKGVRPEIGAYSVTDDSHELGNRFRDEFGITDQVQKKWRDPYDAFNTLRGLIESRNIFVFQMHMPINDARGFVLVDELPAVIVVNSADQIEARVFTLVHELGHVLLRKTGINTPEAGLGRGRIDEVERWCNGFAAEFLVPGKLAKGEFSQHEDTLLEDETLRRISKSLKVSKSMLLVRMKDSGFIEHRELQSALGELRSRGLPPHGEGGFGETVERRVLRERGRRFVSLVAQNVEQGSLDYASAIDFLSIKLRDIDKVMAKASQ